MDHMIITIDSQGTIKYLSSGELKPLEALGKATTKRASHVHPVNRLQRLAFHALRRAFGETGRVSQWTRAWRCPWLVDLAISGGPVLGPFADRADAIAAEQDWIANNL